MQDEPPKKSQTPPKIEGGPGLDAWKKCIETYGYPMTCPGVTAWGYFSEGYRAGRKDAQKHGTET